MSNNTAQLKVELQEILSKGDREGRPLTPDEYAMAHGLRERIKGHVPNVGLLNAEAVAAMYGPGGIGPVGADGIGFQPAMSPGEAFTASEGYKSIKSNRPSSAWTTGEIDTGRMAINTKGTLMEGAGGGGGALAVPVPQVVPGVVDKLFQPLTLERLLLSGVATGNYVRFATEGTATSAAAGVAEAGLKPESTFGYVSTDEPIKKVATTTTIADEILEDAPAIQQLINGRLSLFVQIEAERQLLRGTSGGNEVQGLLTSRSVPVYAGGTAVGNRAIQLFHAMNGMRGSAFLEPEWIVMHPTDYAAVRLLTDSAGQFFAGGPWAGGYGNGQSQQTSGQVTGTPDYLWGKPVYVTSAIGGAGTALIGTSAAAQVWNRGGLTVEATNSHSTNFVYDLTTIRCERRLGLTVLRPNGFVEARIS